MARSFRPIKAKKHVQRLKEQRDSKRTKHGLALKHVGDKSSEAFVELLFLWNSCKEGKCWLTVAQAE